MSKSNQMQEESEEAEELQGDDVYQVEEILKKNYHGTKYLIKWKDYPDPKDYTWQPLQHLNQVMHMVDEFNRKETANFKKKIKKDEEHRVKKKRQIQEKNQKESSSSPQNQPPIEEQKEPEPEKKEKVSKGGYFPKVITKGLYSERPANYEKKTYFSYQSNSKKEQLSKYLAPVMNSVIKADEQDEKIQRKQSEKQRWFNSQPYKLASIFRHVVEKDKINYLCDVENNGDLVCTTELGSKQVGNINKEMEKSYILSVLFNFAKEKARKSTPQYHQVENSWKTCK